MEFLHILLGFHTGFCSTDGDFVDFYIVLYL